MFALLIDSTGLYFCRVYFLICITAIVLSSSFTLLFMIFFFGGNSLSLSVVTTKCRNHFKLIHSACFWLSGNKFSEQEIGWTPPNFFFFFLVAYWDITMILLCCCFRIFAGIKYMKFSCVGHRSKSRKRVRWSVQPWWGRCRLEWLYLSEQRSWIGIQFMRTRCLWGEGVGLGLCKCVIGRTG